MQFQSWGAWLMSQRPKMFTRVLCFQLTVLIAIFQLLGLSAVIIIEGTYGTPHIPVIILAAIAVLLVLINGFILGIYECFKSHEEWDGELTDDEEYFEKV